MSLVKLGESAPYSARYNPGLLEPIARQQSRMSLVGREEMPFVGVDLWTAYELSWLGKGGKPEVAIAEFSFPADSCAIIESKSFKYYLNSFNQTTFTDRQRVLSLLQSDLSSACGGDVQVDIFDIDRYQKNERPLPGICVDTLNVQIDAYQPVPELLTFGAQAVQGQVLYSHLLKSNCPVTGQPDWATVWISCSGRELSPESWLKYVVSFRQHQDFHENCVEKIFCDLMAAGKFESLAVYARYTRRGGLDINPYRATGDLGSQLPAALSAARIPRQ
ncbi:NADPH-dependent 7-cyano-7-deazaguanine reductase QueF [Teredinibacter haidensis]|uniref:NADPH-dependent 7-cyano-7-deazaguanine reductase QueF n=1 Tax=Teredinibacter haidensis TaxID=2731755 RepID=UPI000948FBF4|nr:NADPH-dependent 7-cyano-7-deazaguanine reductase QueF [Teredinibacter haidensis]